MPGSVVVIGGGVIGCASAYYLARAGWQVTVVDRGRLGGGCSHGNCGYICPSHVLPLAAPGAIWTTLKTLFRKNSPLKVRAGFLLRNLGWFLKFARRCNRDDMLRSAVGIQSLLNSSRRLYDELNSREHLECEWDRHGLLFVFQSAAAFEHYAEVDHLLRDRFAMPAKRFDSEALRELEPALQPGSTSGAYLYQSDVQVRPDRMMQELRVRLQNLGVQFREQSELTSFTAKGQTATAALTKTGELSADAFVIATGAWTPLLKEQIGVRVPIIPGKGYSITLDRPEICPRYPMIWEEHRVAVSPFATGLRIGSTMEFAGYDSSLNPRRLQLLRRAAEMYLRDPGTNARVQEEWWGWRPMTPNGLPVIDRSPRFGNVIVAAGHGMLGLSMATGTGKLVQEMLDGQTPHLDAKPYSWGA